MLALALVLAAAPGAHVVVDVKGVPRPAPAAAPAALPPAAVAEAKQLYGTRCALCHGFTGQGDGPSAVGLPVHPRRHSDAVWQASVSDDDIAAVILGGGASRKLSILMPANPDLKARPDVVKALVAVIRGLRSPTGSARATFTAAGRKPLAASADADSAGNAHVDAGPLAPGRYTVVVETAPGAVLCKTSVDVAAAPIHVSCGPASPPLAGRRAP